MQITETNNKQQPHHIATTTSQITQIIYALARANYVLPQFPLDQKKGER